MISRMRTEASGSDDVFRVVFHGQAAKRRFDHLGVRGRIDLEGPVVGPLAVVADSGNSRVSQSSQELRLGQHLVEKRLPHLRGTANRCVQERHSSTICSRTEKVGIE